MYNLPTFSESAKKALETPVSYEIGQLVTLPDGSNLYREGYIFVGWNTDPAATEGFFEIVMQENTVLYAIWLPEKDSAPSASHTEENDAGKTAEDVMTKDEISEDEVTDDNISEEETPEEVLPEEEITDDKFTDEELVGDSVIEDFTETEEPTDPTESLETQNPAEPVKSNENDFVDEHGDA